MFLLLAKMADRTAMARLLDKKFNLISEIKNNDGDLLSMINLILKKNQKTLKQIKSVIAVNDSGTFSGVRSVITIGNTLAFALKIPVVPLSIKDINNKRKLEMAFRRKVNFAIPKYNKNLF